MVVEPPIPSDPTAIVTCVGCGHKAPLKKFTDAFAKEFPMDEDGNAL
jgi:hypothetical protein